MVTWVPARWLDTIHILTELYRIAVSCQSMLCINPFVLTMCRRTGINGMQPFLDRFTNGKRLGEGESFQLI